MSWKLGMGGSSGPQYRLWAESIDVNQHDTMENVPLRSMFKKQASSVPCEVGCQPLQLLL